MSTNKVGTCHQDQITRLKKIEGQIRGVQKMIEEQRYCPDILNQVKAIRSSITSVETNILEGHLNGCIQKIIKSKKADERNELFDEIKILLKRKS